MEKGRVLLSRGNLELGEVDIKRGIYGIRKWSRHSRMDQVKFVEDSFLKICSYMVCLSRPYHIKLFKGCLPQILLFSHILFSFVLGLIPLILILSS